jgi:hypothetical protein
MLADGGQWWGHADYLFGRGADGHAGDQATDHSALGMRLA